MTLDIPSWAMKPVTSEDRKAAQHAYHKGRMQIINPDRKALKAWAKQQGWPTPWFSFEDVFITTMLENDEILTSALNESGIELLIPKKKVLLTAEMLKEFDELYDERSSQDKPLGWGSLVEELREIRRTVEMGVKVEIEGTDTVLKSWQGFYDWSHGRYPLLEDGYDSWIGDDYS